MNRMYSLDDYATMGLDAIVGATSAEDRIQALDDKVHGHDGAVYKWSVDTYGPAGVTAAHPADDNTVAQEQAYLKAWTAFQSDWADWSARRTKALADEKGMPGEGGYDELASAIRKELDKKETEFQSWADRFDKVKLAHGKKHIQGLGAEEIDGFPWAKVLLAVAAIGVVGGACFYLKKKGDEAKEEALKAGTGGALGLRRPSMGDSDSDDRATLIEPMVPAHGMTLGPPMPMPQLNLAPINGRRR